MATLPAKRSKTLVDSEVQGGLIRRVTLHWVVFFACNSIGLLCWIRLFEQPDASWGQTVIDTVRRFMPFFIITAALIPAFAWDTLKLSHRFAGPISRLRNALKDLSAGRAVAPLKFRESDFWHEIASDFNQVMRLQKAQEEESQETSKGSEPADA